MDNLTSITSLNFAHRNWIGDLIESGVLRSQQDLSERWGTASRLATYCTAGHSFATKMGMHERVASTVTHAYMPPTAKFRKASCRHGAPNPQWINLNRAITTTWHFPVSKLFINMLFRARSDVASAATSPLKQPYETSTLPNCWLPTHLHMAGLATNRFF